MWTASAQRREEDGRRRRRRTWGERGVNAVAAPDAAPLARKQELKPKAEEKPSTAGAPKSSKPGSIDPFLSMVRDLNK